ncbi:MAG: hypothetical protein HQL53_09330 [Magnetococcales bacterium]|nr:hypothetical protein [Magnetococcales bacterium]
MNGPIGTASAFGEGSRTVRGTEVRRYSAGHIKLAKKLRVHPAALKTIREILRQKKIPQADRHRCLTEAAGYYRKAISRHLRNRHDAAVVGALRAKAERAIKAGAFSRAEKFLMKAITLDARSGRGVSAAISSLKVGDLMMVQWKYATATKYYKKALALLPRSAKRERENARAAYGEATIGCRR